MPSKQTAAARKNIKKAANAARKNRTIGIFQNPCAPRSAKKVQQPQNASAQGVNPF
jgi:hypothetical protein